MSVTPEECAQELLETAPLIMREIRSQMCSRRTPDLTVPQFRTLVFVEHHTGSSLSEVACHMGTTLPSTSKLVDDLINDGMMEREEHPQDRRRVKLAVTKKGLEILESSRRGTLAYLAKKLLETDAGERENIVKATRVIRAVLQR
ncbi:MAG: MarR family transcriptional regulator [Candidatus Bathyarchaeota archaeon]|nr:MarR family transcriptional regulator [Candidatus Bathyarchaeota archaeon]